MLNKSIERHGERFKQCRAAWTGKLCGSPTYQISASSCSVKMASFSTSVNQKVRITIFTWARQLLSFHGLQTGKNEV